MSGLNPTVENDGIPRSVDDLVLDTLYDTIEVRVAFVLPGFFFFYDGGPLPLLNLKSSEIHVAVSFQLLVCLGDGFVQRVALSIVFFQPAVW